MKRIFNGTKKCAFCGAELTWEEIEEYYPISSIFFESDEEQCPHCGYHNDFIEEVSSELQYSTIL